MEHIADQYARGRLAVSGMRFHRSCVARLWSKELRRCPIRGYRLIRTHYIHVGRRYHNGPWGVGIEEAWHVASLDTPIEGPKIYWTRIVDRLCGRWPARV